MYALYGPAIVDPNGDVVFDFPVKKGVDDSNAFVIEDYPYKLEKGLTSAVVMPGKKPYLPVQVAEAGSVGIAMLAGEVTDVNITDRYQLVKLKTARGPFVSVFLWADDTTPTRGSLVAILATVTTGEDRKGNQQFTFNCRQMTILKDGGPPESIAYDDVPPF